MTSITTLYGYTVVIADEGYLILNPDNTSIMDIAMSLDEACEIINRY